MQFVTTNSRIDLERLTVPPLSLFYEMRDQTPSVGMESGEPVEAVPSNQLHDLYMFIIYHTYDENVKARPPSLRSRKIISLPDMGDVPLDVCTALNSLPAMYSALQWEMINGLQYWIEQSTME